MTKISQKITTFLWFDNQAEEAARFYTSLFEEPHCRDQSLHGRSTRDGRFSHARHVRACWSEIPCPERGGPQYKFNESISLFVECENQGEIDELWSKHRSHCEISSERRNGRRSLVEKVA